MKNQAPRPATVIPELPMEHARVAGHHPQQGPRLFLVGQNSLRSSLSPSASSLTPSGGLKGAGCTVKSREGTRASFEVGCLLPGPGRPRGMQQEHLAGLGQGCGPRGGGGKQVPCSPHGLAGLGARPRERTCQRTEDRGREAMGREGQESASAAPAARSG